MAESLISNLSVVLIGAGNVAWHYGHLLKSKGYTIKQIINRSDEPGRKLATELNTSFCHSFDAAIEDSDLVILTISDSFIPEVVEKINCGNAMVVHTAGSVPMSILKKYMNYGVLYPFQTLTKGVSVNFDKVPICIEASDQENLDSLKLLAGTLSKFVRIVNSEQRKKLHLAGIFLNNFNNYLITLATDYLKKNQLDQDLIMPLLEETFKKVSQLSPDKAQTGPARRNNQAVIDEHLNMLKDEPELKDLYSLISASIIAYYNK